VTRFETGGAQAENFSENSARERNRTPPKIVYKRGLNAFIRQILLTNGRRARLSNKLSSKAIKALRNSWFSRGFFCRPESETSRPRFAPYFLRFITISLPCRQSMTEN